MSMDTLFGRATPWGRKVTSADDLATLFSQDKNQICVDGSVRREWLLGHRVAMVANKKRVIAFDDIGGDLWVAHLFVAPPAPPVPEPAGG